MDALCTRDRRRLAVSKALHGRFSTNVHATASVACRTCACSRSLRDGDRARPAFPQTLLNLRDECGGRRAARAAAGHGGGLDGGWDGGGGAAGGDDGGGGEEGGGEDGGEVGGGDGGGGDGGGGLG
eukprot:scaffold22976_cov114-Isochrysis_galbana.AAC.5